MKRFWLGFLVGALATGAAAGVLLFLGSQIGFGHFNRSGHGFPFAQVVERGGLRISLGGSNSNAVVITRGSDSFTLVPTPGEVYDQPVATSDGRSLFFLVRKELEFGYGYACILRLDFTTNALSSGQSSRILTASQAEALLGKDGGVSDLYKPSPNGDRVLVSIFRREESVDPAGKTVVARFLPHWYDIKNNSFEEPAP